MCILPKFTRKSYGRYFVSKLFKCDSQLDSRVYTVTRLIYDCTAFGYEETESEYSDFALYKLT